MVNIHFGAYTFQSLPLAVKPLAVSANALFVILSEVKDPKTPSSDKKHSACRKSVPLDSSDADAPNRAKT